MIVLMIMLAFCWLAITNGQSKRVFTNPFKAFRRIKDRDAKSLFLYIIAIPTFVSVVFALGAYNEDSAVWKVAGMLDISYILQTELQAYKVLLFVWPALMTLQLIVNHIKNKL